VDNQPSTGSSALSHRGLWFDAAVLAGNIFLLGPLSEFSKSTGGFDPRFGILLIVAAVLYAIGAGFKRRPLQARLAVAKPPPMGTGMMITFFVLMVMHLGLFMLCAMVGAEMIHGAPAGNAPMAPWQVAETVGLVVLALAPTVLTVGAVLNPRTPPEPSPALDRREALADLLLYASCMIILAWWNGSLAELFAGVQAGLPMRILLIILMTVPFSIFYLAPRVLFLFEDYRHPRTWLAILLAILPLAMRIVMHGGK
jgi:hypothetical protein